MRIDTSGVIKMLLVVYVVISVASIDTDMVTKYSVATAILLQYLIAIVVTQAVILAIWIVSEVAEHRWIWLNKTDFNSSDYNVKVWLELLTHYIFMVYVISVYFAYVLYTTGEATQVYSSLPIIVCFGCGCLSYQISIDYADYDD